MNTFFNHTIGIAISLGLLAGCKSAETPPTDRVSLGVNKSARINADITIRVDTITDSRCPTNVYCVVAGQANVILSLRVSSDAQMRRLQFPMYGQTRTDSTTVQFGSVSYKVIIKDVVPYPALGSMQAEKQAVIQVTKL